MIDDECGAIGGMRIVKETEVLEKTFLSVTLSATNPT
jgi:hypothetical protein